MTKQIKEIFVKPGAPNQPEKCLRGQNLSFLIIDDASWTTLAPDIDASQKKKK